MTLGIVTDRGITLGLASRWSRLGGQMIDASVAAIPSIIAAVLVPLTGGLAVAVVPFAIAFSFLYLFLGDGLHQGQSFAKQWLGMRVVDAETGKPCTFGKSFVRNVFTILGPLDWIWIFGERHQRLGDKVAGTIVVVAD
jgi:uncharacterized RDD family membrane protein YckC